MMELQAFASFLHKAIQCNLQSLLTHCTFLWS